MHVLRASDCGWQAAWPSSVLWSQDLTLFRLQVKCQELRVDVAQGRRAVWVLSRVREGQGSERSSQVLGGWVEESRRLDAKERAGREIEKRARVLVSAKASSFSKQSLPDKRQDPSVASSSPLSPFAIGSTATTPGRDIGFRGGYLIIQYWCCCWRWDLKTHRSNDAGRNGRWGGSKIGKRRDNC